MLIHKNNEVIFDMLIKLIIMPGGADGPLEF